MRKLVLTIRLSRKLAYSNGESVSKRLGQVEERARSSHDKQESLFQEVRRSMTENNSLLSSIRSTSTKIRTTLKWFHQLGEELKGVVHSIVKINIATYNAVMSLHAVLPGYSDRILVHQSFTLEDAIGRVAPVHLQFINSWEAFDAVLEARFRTIQGLRKIQAKEYILQEKTSKKEVNRGWSWEGAFLPGQHIEMSLIFENKGDGGYKGTANSCPGCHGGVLGSGNPDAEVQWYGKPLFL